MAHKFLPDDQSNRPTMSESTSRVPHYCISKMAGPSDVGTLCYTIRDKNPEGQVSLERNILKWNLSFLFYKDY
jgi:hypothetical protein